MLKIQQKNFKGKEGWGKIFLTALKSALGSGAEEFKETALGVGVLTALFGGAGKTVQLGGKAVGFTRKAGEKGFKQWSSLHRHTFFKAGKRDFKKLEAEFGTIKTSQTLP